MQPLSQPPLIISYIKTLRYLVVCLCLYTVCLWKLPKQIIFPEARNVEPRCPPHGTCAHAPAGWLPRCFLALPGCPSCFNLFWFPSPTFFIPDKLLRIASQWHLWHLLQLTCSIQQMYVAYPCNTWPFLDMHTNFIKRLSHFVRTLNAPRKHKPAFFRAVTQPRTRADIANIL